MNAPTRYTHVLFLLSIFLSLSFAIPLSTVFRRTTSLLFKRPLLFGTRMHQYQEDRIPPFLRKSSCGKFHSLLGGFCNVSHHSNHWTSTTKRPRTFSSLSSTLKEETTSTSSAAPSRASSDVHSDSAAESTHLQLGSAAMLPSYLQNNNNKDNDDDNEDEPELPTFVLHTYHDAIHNVTLSGFNVNKRKFSAWVQHTLTSSSDEYGGCAYNSSYITSKQVVVDSMTCRQELRNLWKQGRLLTDRTEVLAIYKSDSLQEEIVESEEESSDSISSTLAKKRGGFPDLLHIYAERLSAIIQDEVEEENHMFLNNQTQQTLNNQTTGDVSPQLLELLDGGLLGWLQREYGRNETQQLSLANIQNKTLPQQQAVFQHFLEWFKSRFPYYYDRCDTCGASAKDDPEITCINDDGNDDSEEEEEDDSGSFLGYVYPTEEELLGKASRTEIYKCHKCGSFTRFPRYNAASSVIHHQRGRCGEYSMLLYRILRATGHTCRWIVDWADHVWAEVYLNKKWIHLDPCEAAVDKPLLYEEWGKQQTYIVAFHAPLANGQGSFDRTSCLTNGENGTTVPLIEDVTLRYTSCKEEELQKRRDESDKELQDFVDQTIVELEQKLDRILNK